MARVALILLLGLQVSVVLAAGLAVEHRLKQVLDRIPPEQGATNSDAPETVTPTIHSAGILIQGPPWLFGVGVMGAVFREVFRWQRLASQGRTKRFLKTKYMVTSIIQVLVCASAGVALFGRFAGYPWCYPASFFAAWGLEEVVSIAMGLRAWTSSAYRAREVQEQQLKSDSLREYLRT